MKKQWQNRLNQKNIAKDTYGSEWKPVTIKSYTNDANTRIGDVGLPSGTNTIKVTVKQKGGIKIKLPGSQVDFKYKESYLIKDPKIGVYFTMQIWIQDYECHCYKEGLTYELGKGTSAKLKNPGGGLYVYDWKLKGRFLKLESGTVEGYDSKIDFDWTIILGIPKFKTK